MSLFAVKDSKKDRDRKLEKSDKGKGAKSKGGATPLSASSDLAGLAPEGVDDDSLAAVARFVDCCTDWLSRHKAEEAQGIFRKAGAERAIAAYLDQLAAKGDGSVDFDEAEDEHTVATVLKRFFRDLKEPLLTWDLYETFLGAAGHDDEERVVNIQLALALLPLPNKEILEKIIQYLRQVSLKSEANFMTPSNLAIVFAPNLLRPKVETPLTLISDAAGVTNLVSSFIENVDIYFPPKPQVAPTPAPDESVDAQTASHFREKSEEFKRSMSSRHNSHRSWTHSTLEGLAREASLSEEEMEAKLQVVSSKLKRGDGRALGMLFGHGLGSARSLGVQNNFQALQQLAQEASKPTSEVSTEEPNGTDKGEDDLDSLKAQALDLNLDGLALPSPDHEAEDKTAAPAVPPSLNVIFSKEPNDSVMSSPDKGAKRPKSNQGLLANLTPDMRIKLGSANSSNNPSPLSSPKPKTPKSPFMRQQATSNFHLFLQEIIANRELSDDEDDEVEEDGEVEPTEAHKSRSHSKSPSGSSNEGDNHGGKLEVARESSAETEADESIETRADRHIDTASAASVFNKILFAVKKPEPSPSAAESEGGGDGHDSSTH